MAEPVKPACVDLRAVFGDRFKIRKEADGETWGATPEAERVWLWELPCRFGIVYPQGGDVLAATVTGTYARQKVRELPCLRSRRGDVELVVTFHVDDAEMVLSILKPRLRRRLSPEQRARITTQIQRVNQERREAPAKGHPRDPRIDAAPAGDPIPSPEGADAKQAPKGGVLG